VHNWILKEQRIGFLKIRMYSKVEAPSLYKSGKLPLAAIFLKGKKKHALQNP
jgi:hypothetical protein